MVIEVMGGVPTIKNCVIINKNYQSTNYNYHKSGTSLSLLHRQHNYVNHVMNYWLTLMVDICFIKSPVITLFILMEI